MTVSELIEKLKEMPQDALVYTEGELADTVILEDVILENCKVNQYVRIFKAWNVEFVNGYKVIGVYENGKESE